MCDDHFSDIDAEVVCRDLGYSTTNARARIGAYYEPGSGITWLNNIRCTGTESHLTSCYNSGWEVDDSPHTKDVGVSCSKLTYNRRFCMLALTPGYTHCRMFFI